MANLARPKKYTQSTSFGDPVVLLARPHKNIAPDSNLLDSTEWTKASGTSVSANTILAPNGQLLADKLKESSTASAIRSITHRVYYTNTSTHSVTGRGLADGALAYTFSCFLKAGERTSAVLEVNENGDSSKASVVISNLGGTPSASTPTATNWTVDTSPITDAVTIQSMSLDNLYSWNSNVTGWYRCFLTFTTDAGFVATNGFNLVIKLHQDSAYTGVVDHGLYVWGIQFEQATAAVATAGAYQTSRYAKQVVKLDRSQSANPSYWTTGPLVSDNPSVSQTLRSLWVEYISDDAEGSLLFAISTDGGATWSSNYSTTIVDTNGAVTRSRIPLAGAAYTGTDIRIKLDLASTKSLVRVVSLIPEITPRGKI